MCVLSLKQSRLLRSTIVVITSFLLSTLGAILADTNSRYASQIYSDSKEGIVLIETFDGDGYGLSQGTGFFIDGEGVVATNLHVLDGACAIKVSLNGVSSSDVDLLLWDEVQDYAVIRVTGVSGKPLKLGSSEDIQEGNIVFALGFPKTTNIGHNLTITQGLYSGKIELMPGSSMLQFSAPISPGSSGGPLLDINGKVIGITTASIPGQDSNDLNLAVAIDSVRKMVLDVKPRVIAELCGSKIYHPLPSQVGDPTDPNEALARLKVFAERIHNATKRLAGIKSSDRKYIFNSILGHRNAYMLSWIDLTETYSYNVYKVDPELSIVTTFMGYVEIPVRVNRQNVIFRTYGDNLCDTLTYQECCDVKDTKVLREKKPKVSEVSYVWGLAYREGVWKIWRVFDRQSSRSFIRYVHNRNLVKIYKEITGSN